MPVYHHYLDTLDDLSVKFRTFLDSELTSTEESTRVLLVFDEAQRLLEENSSGMHALRKFLRFRGHCLQIVALVAGTTTCLANWYPREPKLLSFRHFEPLDDCHESGNPVYGPIFEFYTMGCFAERIKLTHETATDLDRAVPYGRPLVARMLFSETDDTETQYPVPATSSVTDIELARIASRMLLGIADPCSWCRC